jgi:hypothetical protein
MYGYKKTFFTKNINLVKTIDSSFFQYLHSYSLSFRDPKTNELKTYTADYPQEYSLLLDELNRDNND